jgi:hypothetical protein
MLAQGERPGQLVAATNLDEGSTVSILSLFDCEQGVLILISLRQHTLASVSVFPFSKVYEILGW